MRKFILLAAILLASASASTSVLAGQSRGLTLASNDEPAIVDQSRAAPQAAPAPAPQTEAPKFVERPPAVAATTPTTTTTTSDAPKTEKPVAKDTAKDTPKADRTKRRESTEARVIRELHRHGIYW